MLRDHCTDMHPSRKPYKQRETQGASSSVMYDRRVRAPGAVWESPVSMYVKRRNMDWKNGWGTLNSPTTSFILQIRNWGLKRGSDFSLRAHLCQDGPGTVSCLPPWVTPQFPRPPLCPQYYCSSSWHMRRCFSFFPSSLPLVILFYPYPYSCQKGGTVIVTVFCSEEDEFQKDKGEKFKDLGVSKDLQIQRARYLEVGPAQFAFPLRAEIRPVAAAKCRVYVVFRDPSFDHWLMLARP